jgi:hypothetical protein
MAQPSGARTSVTPCRWLLAEHRQVKGLLLCFVFGRESLHKDAIGIFSSEATLSKPTGGSVVLVDAGVAM